MNKEKAKLITKYKKILDFCHIAKVTCFLYAFLCVLYWFFNLANPDILKPLAFLFEPVFAIIKIFYVQKTFSTTQVDLTAIVTAVIFIVLAIIVDNIRYHIETLEQKELINLQKKQQADDIKAQKQIELEYIKEMKKYNKFIALVDFNVQQIKSYLVNDSMDEDDIRGLKLSLMTELFKTINENYIISKAKYGQDGFYIIGLIEKTPECIHKITSAIKDISKRYSSTNITLTHDISFDAISDKTNIDEKLEFLEKVIQLNYNDSTLTTSLFKTCYEIISKSTLKFTVLGKFQFLIGSKSNYYELYSVKIN